MLCGALQALVVYFCGDDHQNHVYLVIPVVLVIFPLSLQTLLQVPRVSKIQDSYCIREEFLFVGILNVAVYFVCFSFYLMQKFHVFMVDHENFGISFFITGVNQFLNNVVLYISIMMAIHMKKTNKIVSYEQFSKFLKDGNLESLKNQLAADFCIEYYNFFKEFDDLDPYTLYEKYVKVNSEQELNLSRSARQKVIENLGNLQKIHFDRVKGEATMLIFTNSFPRTL